MYGKFPKYLDKGHMDIELSFEWMKHTGLKGETEGLITAAQDQALNTTTANISSKMILLTNVECVRANQKKWNTSYLDFKH